MKILLDTHLILWTLIDQKRLTTAARAMIDDPDNLLFFSTVSLWEIAIKVNTGKKDFRADPRILREAMLNSDYSELPVLGTHALAIANMPAIHKDPFDRMLIAQATVEGIILLTSDRKVGQYPGPIRLV